MLKLEKGIYRTKKDICSEFGISPQQFLLLLERSGVAGRKVGSTFIYDEFELIRLMETRTLIRRYKR